MLHAAAFGIDFADDASTSLATGLLRLLSARSGHSGMSGIGQASRRLG
jgi:hypothetical protein